MKSKITESFRQSYGRLPDDVRALVRKNYKLWRADPFHPGLQFKRIHNTEPVWSARVGIHYRVVGVKDDDTMIWYFLGTHREYERLVRNL